MLTIASLNTRGIPLLRRVSYRPGPFGPNGGLLTFSGVIVPTATRSAGMIRAGSTRTCMSSRASMTSRWPAMASGPESKIPPAGDLIRGVPAPVGTWPDHIIVGHFRQHGGGRVAHDGEAVPDQLGPRHPGQAALDK